MKRLACMLAVAGCLVWQPAVAQTAINHVVAVAKPRHYEGPCPASIEFAGTIFVNHPATVSYRWERSDHATGPVETIVIRSAGQGVYTHWQLNRPPGQVFHGSQTLHVLSPGDFISNPAEFTVVCR
jgi:hypothetical protein